MLQRHAVGVAQWLSLSLSVSLSLPLSLSLSAVPSAACAIFLGLFSSLPCPLLPLVCYLSCCPFPPLAIFSRAHHCLQIAS